MALNVRVPEDLGTAVKIEAFRRRVTLQDRVRAALAQYLGIEDAA
jgi:hypothetical protein